MSLTAYATTYESLTVGMVLHPGDTINTSTAYILSTGNWLNANTWTLVRGNITSKPPFCNESDSGAYYFLKNSDGTVYVDVNFGEVIEGCWPVSDTSDGIYVESLNGSNVTFAVHVASAKQTQTITASDVTATYGDTDKSVSASVTTPTTGGGAISYAVKTGSENYIDVAADGKLTIKAVPPTDGKAYVIVTAAETNDYAETTKEVTVTVSKADPTAPTGLTATYGQTLANVTLPDGWTWVDSTQSVGNVVDPAATFKANFAGDDNHNAASNVDVTVTVGKANAVAATVTANSRTYDGTEKPLVTVTGEATGGEMQYALGTATEATEPYTTSIPAKTDAGTYYVWYKVVGDENHLDTNPQCLTVIIKGYNTVDGEGKVWIKGSSDSLEFTFRDTVEDNTYGQFMDGGKMYLDGSATPMVINTDFIARKGSLIITLEPSYLETLSTEKHTLKVVFGDTGEVNTYFYVQNKSIPSGGESSDSSASYKLPKTGIE